MYQIGFATVLYNSALLISNMPIILFLILHYVNNFATYLVASLYFGNIFAPSPIKPNAMNLHSMTAWTMAPHFMSPLRDH